MATYLDVDPMGEEGTAFFDGFDPSYTMVVDPTLESNYYQWSSIYSESYAHGSGITLGPDGIPVAGLIDQIRITEGDGSGIDVSINFDEPISIAGLFSPEGTPADEAATRFWTGLLSGDDHFYLLASDGHTAMFGDFYRVSNDGAADTTVTGGSDGASISLSGFEGNGTAEFIGDAISVGGAVVDGALVTATLFGGHDVISTGGGIAGATLYGDAGTVTLGGVVHGGDDQIFSNATQSRGGLTALDILAGDVGLNQGGRVEGGADTIIGPENGSVAIFATLIGDVERQDSGTTIGGDDSITGREARTTISGDVGNAIGMVVGGDDTIVGGNGRVSNIAGDVLYAGSDSQEMPGFVDIHGGNDTISNAVAYSNGAQNLIAGDVLTIRAIAEGSTIVGGDDTISGGPSPETIYGDLGVIEHPIAGLTLIGGDDVIDGGGGNDTIFGDFASPVGAAPAGLFDQGGDDSLTGGAGVDYLYGGSGNDTLSGEYLRGGKGDDTYVVESGLVNISEAGGGGVDTVLSQFTFSLVASSKVSGTIENLTLTGTSDVDATGNASANALAGNSGANLLSGGSGGDTMHGGGGADRLIGGTGADHLYGDAGADRFIFQSLISSTLSPGGRDLVLDFRRGDGDKIDLRTIDADAGLSGNQAFDFVGTHLFTHTAGELRYSDRGGYITVYADVDGDAHTDFAIDIAGRSSIAASDFLL